MVRLINIGGGGWLHTEIVCLVTLHISNRTRKSNYMYADRDQLPLYQNATNYVNWTKSWKVPIDLN